jgi:hypothetical protein
MPFLARRQKWHPDRERGHKLEVLLAYLADEEVGGHLPVYGAEPEVVLAVKHFRPFLVHKATYTQKVEIQLAGFQEAS